MASTTSTGRERFSLLRDPHPARVATFAEDVRAGLGVRPMRISPKYFYDDLGSALFDAITRLPEYYLTRVERDLLATYGREIVASLAGPLELIELGSGSAVKTRLLIDALLDRQHTLTYRPIDISAEAVTESSLALTVAYDRLRVTAYASDYVPLLREKRLETRERALALFLGSNIGNFEPQEARALLTLLAGALRRGDALLLGYDLKKDPSILQLAYDDPTGVTAAFNKNLLARINRELGADFDLTQFRHEARWNRTERRIEMHLRSLRAQSVTISAALTRVDFEEGETIWTESSHKYRADEVLEMAKRTGFRCEGQWIDEEWPFAQNLLICE
jgi:dimethylhistidine N-methyltransferase